MAISASIIFNESNFIIKGINGRLLCYFKATLSHLQDAHLNFQNIANYKNDNDASSPNF